MIFDEKRIKNGAVKPRLLAFDLDGTLTQHKSRLDAPARAALTALSEHYRLLMVGAGRCRRIFEQMERFPIDIIGNYGMEYAEYDAETGDIRTVFDETVPCCRETQLARAEKLRDRYGFTQYAGDSLEFHASGCVTFAILGTAAQLPEINLSDPGDIIGKNTVDAMKSGVVYGAAAMVDGMSARMSKRMGTEVTVVATGGLSGAIIPHCERKINHEPDLQLKGLYILYNKNK